MVDIQIPNWLIEFALGYIGGAISLFSYGVFLHKNLQKQQQKQQENQENSATKPPNSPLTRVK